MIPFNIPVLPASTQSYFEKVLGTRKFSGDGEFTKACNRILEEYCHTPKALLTTSCTHALEVSAILSEIREGDEVIMPSFTFVTTANAFVMRGATIVFVDITPGTMNMDASQIEKAITPKTRAIVPMHYGGVACDMETILSVAQKHQLRVVEDAAQGLGAFYKDKSLGSLGDFGTFSFHDTKNIHCGEGGALLINNQAFVERAEIIREKGTDRSRFVRGLVDKYTWRDIGSSYLPSEFNAAILYPQLLDIDGISQKRLSIWNQYNQALQPLAEKGLIQLPVVPEGCRHNGHVFFIKCKDQEERNRLMAYLKSKEVFAVSHYVPLHSSPAGQKFGRFSGEDKYTTRESERLLRLPLYYDLSQDQAAEVTDHLFQFYA